MCIADFPASFPVQTKHGRPLHASEAGGISRSESATRCTLAWLCSADVTCPLLPTMPLRAARVSSGVAVSTVNVTTRSACPFVWACAMQHQDQESADLWPPNPYLDDYTEATMLGVILPAEAASFFA